MTATHPEQVALGLRDENGALRIGLVSAFPPGKNSLNEFGWHVVNALAEKDDVAEVILFADETDSGAPTPITGVTPVVCWSFNKVTNLAVALIGRAVFFLSWSAVTALFPAVEQRDEAGEASGGLLLGGLAVVGSLCTFMVIMATVVGDKVFTSALGDAYAGVGHLLVTYAIATSLFTLANLIVSHHPLTGRVLEAGILLAGGVLQTALLLMWNSTPEVVVQDQLIAMGILLAAVSATTVLVKHEPQSQPTQHVERVES